MPALRSHLHLTNSTTMGWLLVLFTFSCLISLHPTPVSGSQLFFVSSDDCTYDTSRFDSPALSAGAELLARAQLELSSTTIRDVNLNTQAQSCPSSSGSGATSIGVRTGINSFDFTSGRLFQIILTSSSGTSGSYQFSSSVKITNYTTQPATQTQLSLPGTSDVQLIQYHPITNQLLAITRNGPSVLLQALDIATSTTVSSATTLLDLSSNLGQALIMDGLSALDVTGNKLLVLTSAVGNGIKPTTTYFVVTIDLTTLSISSTYSFGSSITSVEGMSWLPNLGECLLVSFDAAFRFNPSTQVLTQLSSVDSALNAIRTAAGNTPLTSLQTSVYFSTHLWYAALSLSTNSGTSVPYASLISTGLVSMVVQAANKIQPLLLLIDAANNECHIDSLPRPAGGSIAGMSSTAGQTTLVSIQTYAPTPTITNYAPTTISGAGGMLVVNGTDFFHLAGLIGSAPICRFGTGGVTIATTSATVLNSTTLICNVPPTSLSLLGFELVFMNETVTTTTIDINQCLVNNGGCHSPALCIHSYGSNSCSYSTCTNATVGSGCTCLQGYTSAAKTIAHCDACPVSTYKPLASFDSCTKCPTYSTSAAASDASTDCSCLASFTTKVDGSCTMTGSGATAAIPVSVTFSVQSNWPTSIPSDSDVSLQGQKPFKDGIIADLSLALGISASRLTVDSLALDTTANSTLSSNGSGGIYVLVSVSILPWSLDTGSDTSLDSSDQPYTPTQLAQFLELLTANPESALYSGTWTKTIRASTLTAQAEPEVVATVPWVKTTTGTAIIFFGAVLILGLIVFGLSQGSPSEARVLDLATVVLAVTNTITNFLFIIYLKNNLNVYDFSGAYYASLVVFFAPLAFNLGVTIYRMSELVKSDHSEPCGVIPRMSAKMWKAYRKSSAYKQGEENEQENVRKTFHEWFLENTASTALICVFAILSIDCLALLTSQILWRKELSAPWKDGKALVNILGLIDVIFRDFPQLIIQIVVTQRTHTWSTLQELSVASSGMAVFFGLLVRGLTLLLRHLDKTKKHKAAATNNHANKEIELTKPAPAIGGQVHYSPSDSAIQPTACIGCGHQYDHHLLECPSCQVVNQLARSPKEEISDSPIPVSSPTLPVTPSVDNQGTPQPAPSPVSNSTMQQPPYNFPTRNVILRVSNIMMISLCMISLLDMNHHIVQVDGGLTTTSDGHILTAPLSVYGNVSVIDSQGVNQNLLALIQQQSQLLQQQTTAIQQQLALINQQQTTISSVNATVQQQGALISSQSTSLQQQSTLIQQLQNQLSYSGKNAFAHLSYSGLTTGPLVVSELPVNLQWNLFPGETFLVQLDFYGGGQTSSGSPSCLRLWLHLPSTVVFNNTGTSDGNAATNNWLSQCVATTTATKIIALSAASTITTPQLVSINVDWFGEAGVSGTVYYVGLTAWSS